MSEKRNLIGIDEAGRGPLAGPVVACAIINKGFSMKNLKDSKRLSFNKREEIYEMLKNDSRVSWGIGRVSEKVIDRINILEATKLAMKRAVNNLGEKNCILMIDGNFGISLDIPQKSVVKGDETVFLIKLASIVAKVSRDRMMLRYHSKYPQYHFDKHKGYPTKLHIKMLNKHGVCDIHRRTFNPVRKCVRIKMEG